MTTVTYTVEELKEELKMLDEKYDEFFQDNLWTWHDVAEVNDYDHNRFLTIDLLLQEHDILSGAY